MARLLLECRGERREIPITGAVTVGRSKTATIQVDDLQLSREHSQVYIFNGQYHVRDLGSKNGTFLNGTLLHGPELLRTGDRIRIGPAYLTFFLLETSAGQAPAPPPPPPVVRASVPTATAAPVGPARARPRRVELREEGDAAAGFLPGLLVLGVMVGGAYGFKLLFLWAFSQVPS